MAVSSVMLIAGIIVIVVIVVFVWLFSKGSSSSGGGKSHSGGKSGGKALASAYLIKRGDAEAQNAAGTLYAKGGEGFMQNHRKAAAWYEKAAEKGLTQAQINYGAMFEYGQGVIKSYITAYMWYTLAYDHADSETKELLNDKTKTIARSMTQEQIMEARKRANDWRQGIRNQN